MSSIVLSNKDARRLFLHRHALSGPVDAPTGRQGLLDLIRRLGFVQLDSINTVARAHDLILFSRRSSYRPRQLALLLERDRALFEHWTHDAAMLPVEFFPWWRHRFERERDHIAKRWSAWRREGFQDQFEAVLTQIRDQGPCGSGDVGEGEERGKSGAWWDWHPSKTALEYLWRVGELSVTRRDAFRKIYDLSHRVIPREYRTASYDHETFVDWACRSALSRLGFATWGEIAAFWDLVSPEEAKMWCATTRDLVQVAVTGSTGKVRIAYAFSDLLEAAAAAPEPPGSLRILSPFDPALRDRKRAEWLFGFHYRIEIFVPEARRRYGYYVFPMLEGDRLVGRIDMKCQRKDAVLSVRAVWPEAGFALGKGRMGRLEVALDRIARFTGMDRIVHQDGWIREPLTI